MVQRQQESSDSGAVIRVFVPARPAVEGDLCSARVLLSCSAAGRPQVRYELLGVGFCAAVVREFRQDCRHCAGIRTGSVALRVHDRGRRICGRIAEFPPTRPTESWVVPGRSRPFDQPRAVTTGAVVEGLEHHDRAVGVIDFELAGVAAAAAGLQRRDGGLHILFTDATSGVTTYPACRSLSVADAGGGRGGDARTSTGPRTCRAHSRTTRRARWRLPRTG